MYNLCLSVMEFFFICLVYCSFDSSAVGQSLSGEDFNMSCRMIWFSGRFCICFVHYTLTSDCCRLEIKSWLRLECRWRLKKSSLTSTLGYQLIRCDHKLSSAQLSYTVLSIAASVCIYWYFFSIKLRFRYICEDKFSNLSSAVKLTWNCISVTSDSR